MLHRATTLLLMGTDFELKDQTKGKMVEERIAFGNLDVVGTTQPHDDALVVTLGLDGSM